LYSAFTIWNQQNSGEYHEKEAPADWWNRIVAGLVAVFTGALAWLAHKQSGVMEQQRKAISEQADSMRRGVRISIAATRIANRNAIAARDAASAADQNAKTAVDNVEMLISKERGRLRIEFEEVAPEVVNRWGDYSVRFNVILSGNSQVEVIDYDFICDLVGSGTTKSWEAIVSGRPQWNPGFFPSLTFPRRIITVQDPVVPFKTQAFYNTSSEVDQPTVVGMLKKGTIEILCVGFVLYKDIFERKWRLKFNRRWTYNTVAGSLGGLGLWEDDENPKENGEYSEQP
jgi:hypothetical protein